ncbi:MAG: hypothetical protein WBP81_11945 [Solirubrobacteraceae bacterium]
MSEDWRLRIDLHQSGIARSLTERLNASELEHDIARAFHDRVVVSRDRGEVFCYLDSREQADRVEELIRSVADEHHWEVETELRRWHPSAQEWEDADKPLPESDAQLAAERAELLANERREAQARGYPAFEVRLEASSHDAALELANKLRGEGIPSVQRSNYLLIGVADEDTAQALAERLRAEAPAGCVVVVEGTGREVFDDQLPNPFAILGGLAG